MTTQKNRAPTPDGGDDQRDPQLRGLQLAIGRFVRARRVEMGHGQESFAKAVGMHVNTLGKIERAEAVADIAQLCDLARVMGVELRDLLTLDPPAGSVDPLADADLTLVPAYDVKASAGNGSPVQSEAVIGRYAFSRSWLARKGLKIDHIGVVQADGDSMEPTVRSGDILLVDLSGTRLSADGIYLVEKDNELFCKRLQRLFDGGVAIMSDNPKYETQHLTPAGAEGLHVVGRVVWIGGER